jgi:hypothetical protein
MERGRQPPFSLPYTNSSPLVEVTTRRRPPSLHQTMSLETTPPRRSRRPQMSPSLVQELDQVFNQRQRATWL